MSVKRVGVVSREAPTAYRSGPYFVPMVFLAPFFPERISESCRETGQQRVSYAGAVVEER